MENPNQKEVLFSDFCKKCEFFEKNEAEEPCNSCLEEGARVDSVRPEKFLERKRRKKNENIKK